MIFDKMFGQLNFTKVEPIGPSCPVFFFSSLKEVNNLSRAEQFKAKTP